VCAISSLKSLRSLSHLPMSSCLYIRTEQLCFSGSGTGSDILNSSEKLLQWPKLKLRSYTCNLNLYVHTNKWLVSAPSSRLFVTDRVSMEGGDWKRGSGKREIVKNAGVEKAGVEFSAPKSSAGKRGSGIHGTRIQGWKTRAKRVWKAKMHLTKTFLSQI